MQQKIFSELFTYHFPSFWYLPGALSYMHRCDSYQVSLCQSSCHNRFWIPEAIMDLAFWEISVVYFVMQMEACDF